MSEIKVWLGGEGSCELGTRADRGDEPGVIEALLRKVEPSGWRVDGATRWRQIRKFRVGAGARGGSNHEDIHNVCGLALRAIEEGVEVLAFVRDVDADEDRVRAIQLGIEAARDRYPRVHVIGGCALPALEGWILALLETRNTDDMSRRKTLELLSAKAIDDKTYRLYVPVVEAADVGKLPEGCGSLCAWLAVARAELGVAVHGVPAS